MDQELLCPVCGELFEDPVMLQCTHHLCACHLEGTNNERVACPVCEAMTVVSDGKLFHDRTLQLVVNWWQEQKTLQAANTSNKELPLCGFCEDKIAVKRCVQCKGVLCEDCVITSHSKGFFKNHTFAPLDGPEEVEHPMTILCHAHADEKLNFYCLDCRTPVCSHCLILGEHKGHQQTPLESAFATGKETLGAWVEKVSQHIACSNDLFNSLRLAEMKVNQGAESQRNLVGSAVDHLAELIQTKHQQLLSKSALEEKQKLLLVQAQIEQIETVRDEARRLLSRSKDLLNVRSEHAFLAVVLPLIQDIKKCSSQVFPPIPSVGGFRPLSTDAQARSLGDLELIVPRA